MVVSGTARLTVRPSAVLNGRAEAGIRSGAVDAAAIVKLRRSVTAAIISAGRFFSIQPD